MLSSVLNADLKKYEGMTFTEIGKALGKDPRDAVMDLVVADRGESYVIISIMDEADVRTALAHPLVSIDTDSGARAEDGPLSDSKSHPRAWGTFPRILGKYVREEKLLTLEEAIRKMTSRAAARVGLKDRGILRAGPVRRRHRLRSGHHPRRRDLRGSEPLRRRREARLRQRRRPSSATARSPTPGRAGRSAVRDTNGVTVSKPHGTCFVRFRQVSTGSDRFRQVGWLRQVRRVRQIRQVRWSGLLT